MTEKTAAQINSPQTGQFTFTPRPPGSARIEKQFQNRRRRARTGGSWWFQQGETKQNDN